MMKVNNWDTIVEKALSDVQFKRRLLAEPVKVLAEEGTVVPNSVTVTVVEQTPTEVWLVLPNHKERVKFLSPYVAVCEVDGVEAPGCDPKTCKNPAAGCAK
jgi:hypothetical protein